MKHLIVVVVVVACLVSSCTADAAAPASAPVLAAPPPGTAASVLDTYEQMRVLLASDSVAGIVVLAQRLGADAARVSLEPDRAGAREVVTATAALTAANTTVDLVKARLAFGEISRGVVALIAADPTLQGGRFLFSCPMAPGYQRWVQTAPRMANPYMGLRMLLCGELVAKWAVDG